MEKECSCNDFVEKENLPKDILNNFNILIGSKPENASKTYEGEYTSLLKCPKCDSYYLANINNSIQPNQKTLSLRKYNSKVEERVLIKTLKFLEGIVTDIELDDYSELRAVVYSALKRKRKK